MRAEEAGFTKDEINGLLSMCVKDYSGIKPKPYLVAFKGESISEDYVKYMEVERGLMERTGQLVLHITGADMLIDTYVLKESLLAIRSYTTRVRETGSLGITVLKPSYPRMAKILSATADIHLRIKREHGALLIYDVKPRQTSTHLKWTRRKATLRRS